MARLTLRSIAWLLTAVLIVCGLLYLFTRARRLSNISHSKRQYDESAFRETQQQTEFLRQNADPRVPLSNYSTEKLRKAAQLLHNGIPDKWTSFGSLVTGVPPNAYHAKYIYAELVRRGDQSVLVPYAELLEYGVAGQEDVIDLTEALRLREIHVSTLTDPYEQYNALDSVQRLSPPQDRPDIAAVRTELAQQMAAQAAIQRAANKQYNFNIPAYAGTTTTTNPRQIRTTNEDIWMLPPDAFRAPNPVQNVNTQTGPVFVRSDGHNTHDSTVTKTVKASVDRLRAGANPSKFDNAKAAREVRAMIESAATSNDRRQNAIAALDAIERNNQTLMTLDMKETDLLGLVWTRMHHDDNLENQQALRENLVDELSACIENGKPVCTSGRFTRILDTLNGVDKQVDIKPKWAISKEMVDKAGIMYQDKVQKLTETEKQAVNALEPNAEQEQLNNDIISNVKNDIKMEFKKSYVDQGIMSQEALDVEMSKWLDHIA